MSEPVTAEELASVDDLVRTLDSTEISEADLDLAIRRTIHLMPRLARDLTAERDTSARLADKVLDLGRELEALRDAVRAHEAAAKGDPSRLVIAAERMWAAAKT